MLKAPRDPFLWHFGTIRHMGTLKDRCGVEMAKPITSNVLSGINLWLLQMTAGVIGFCTKLLKCSLKDSATLDQSQFCNS